MQELKNKLRSLRHVADHPIYHPEKTVGRHIALVTLKAMLYTGDVNMVMAGLLHDVCKRDSGEYKTVGDRRYWLNPDHPKEAYEFIHSSDDVRYFIKYYGGDYEYVADLCLWHMACKESIPKKAKHISNIHLFPILDDMVDRKRWPTYNSLNIYLPDMKLLQKNRKLFYVGMSPLQISRGCYEFTISFKDNSGIHYYPFAAIPEFFVGEWSYLRDYVELLVGV